MEIAVSFFESYPVAALLLIAAIYRRSHSADADATIASRLYWRACYFEAVGDSTLCQVLSGLYAVIRSASSAVRGPRSFS